MSIDTRCPFPSIVLLPKYPFGVGCKKRTRSKPRVPSSNPQVALFSSFPPSGLKLLLYIGGRGVQDGLKFEADSAKRRLSPSWKTVTRERRFFEKKFLTEVRFVREERMWQRERGEREREKEEGKMCMSHKEERERERERDNDDRWNGGEWTIIWSLKKGGWKIFAEKAALCREWNVRYSFL